MLMFLLRHHHVNELYLDPKTPVHQRAANYQFVHYTALFLGIFFLYFTVADYAFFMLHFFHTTLFSCCTLLMLHHFHVILFSTLIFSCCTICTLSFFHVALCSYCTILILYFVCVALFLCTALFHVALLHVAKFLFCIFLLLLSSHGALCSCWTISRGATMTPTNV